MAYLESIDIETLYKCLGDYIKNHPEDKKKPIYHDALHLTGEIKKNEDYLELY